MPHRPRARESTRKRQRTLLRRGQSVGATRAWELRKFAAISGYVHEFPSEMANMEPEGAFQINLNAEMRAVSDAKARKQKHEPRTPRKPEFRTFLERYAHESVNLKKMICAVLDDDASACGGADALLGLRDKVRTFFAVETLPDAYTMGHKHMDPDYFRINFQGVGNFYYNLSEKHAGEFAAIMREDIPGVADHSKYVKAFHGAASGEPIPDVHAYQFMPYNVEK